MPSSPLGWETRTNILRYCLNPHFLALIGAGAFAIAILAPQAFGAALPLLVLAACPLSMALMAATMARSPRPEAPGLDAESIRTEIDALAERRRQLVRELAAAERDRAR